MIIAIQLNVDIVDIVSCDACENFNWTLNIEDILYILAVRRLRDYRARKEEWNEKPKQKKNIFYFYFLFSFSISPQSASFHNVNDIANCIWKMKKKISNSKNRSIAKMKKQNTEQRGNRKLIIPSKTLCIVSGQ